MRDALRESRVAGAVLWLCAGGCLALAAIRTFGLESGFVTVVLVAWTPLFVPVALLAIALALLARRGGPAAVAALASILLIVAVAPRAIGLGHDPAGADGAELRLLSANLNYGEADAERTVGLVRELGVDVLCAVELTPAAARRLRAAGLDEKLPNTAGEAVEGFAGSAIYSLHRLEPLPPLEPDGYGFHMPAALVRFPGGERVEVGCVHPGPPTGGAAMTAWRDGLRALPAAAASESPRILAGDFNATLDHAELRRLIATGYVDAAAARGGGLIPTWPSGLMRPPVTIDHVLVDERARVLDYGVHGLDRSDHRAVFAAVRLPRAPAPGSP